MLTLEVWKAFCDQNPEDKRKDIEAVEALIGKISIGDIIDDIEGEEPLRELSVKLTQLGFQPQSDLEVKLFAMEFAVAAAARVLGVPRHMST